MLQRLGKALYARLLLFCVLFLTAGIAAGLLLPVPKLAALILLGASLLLLIPCFLKKQHWLLLILAASVGLCAALYNTPLDASFPYEAGDEVGIYGEVSRTYMPAAEDENASFYIRPEDIDGVPFRRGEIRIFCAFSELPSRGDRVLVFGTVMEEMHAGNFNQFDYADYLRRNGVMACVSAQYGGKVTLIEPCGSGFINIIEDLRRSLNALIQRLEPEQAAAVRGIMLGDKSDLSYAQREGLVRAGILHAFAVSGLHVGYVLAFGMMIFAFLKRFRGVYFICNAVLLVFYGFFMGFSPSVLRAVVMALVGLFAWLFREKEDGLTALAIAAAICLLYRPAWLLEAGFQLSFVTVFFIIYLGGTMQEAFAKARRARSLIALTVSAGLASMPLVAYYFYTVSPVSFVVSPLAVFMVGACVVWGLAAMLTVGIYAPVAWIFVYVSGVVLDFVIWLSQKLTELVGSFFVVGTPLPQTLLIYYALLLPIPLLHKITKKKIVLIVCLVLAFAFPCFNMHWHRQMPLDGGVLEVSFLDVGQGDCTLISSPDGKTVLIDGGGEGNSGSVGEYVLLPYLKSRGIDKIDLIINTHPDFDHTDGLISVLDNMHVGYCMVSSAYGIDNDAIEAAVDRNDVTLLYATSGKTITLCEGAELDVIFPAVDLDAESDNEASVICLLTYGEHSFIFTGDTEGEGLDFLIDSGLSANVLKVPHHGSKSNFDELLYESVQPEYAVISCGADNIYGHPHKIVTDYLQEQGIEILRTDKSGEIDFFTNGSELTYRTFK